MKRPILRLCTFVILGAIINIAVAWGLVCSVNSQKLDGAAEVEIDDDIDGWTGSVPADWPPPHYGERSWQCGILVEHLSADNSDLGGMPLSEFRQWTSDRMDAGWPMLCLRSFDHRFATQQRTDELSTPFQRGIMVPQQWLRPTGSPQVCLPVMPIGPGFAINTAFYAMTVWLLLTARGAVRRHIRTRRGQCPTCAYPVGASDVCTECGGPVARRSTQD